jgi:allophanate hydrolase
MTENQPFDIGSMHAAYAMGWPVSEMIETVFARIETVADPGITAIAAKP